MPASLVRKLALVVAVAVPALVLRVLGHGPAPMELLVYGAAIVAASFLLAWAAEAAQVDISGGLAIAILALIAVLPEYAIDLYFAYTAGHDPAYASYAAANMTGSNRLLLGVGWPLVAFVALRAISRRQGRPVRELLLSRRRRVELAFLGVGGLLAFVMPLTRQIHVALAGVLLALFAIYLWKVARGGVTEPELIGTPARIAGLPRRPRRLIVASLFTVAAVVVLASAEPFAHALIDTGSQLGIDKFLLVQWLAPLASEAPEFIVAVLLARRGNADDAMGTLLSSKVNQWTLLVGSIPLAYLAGGGGSALHLDGRQVEEVLLTATQTALGFAVLCRLRFHKTAAAALLVLFAAQLALPGTGARLVISALYAVLAIAWLVVPARLIRRVGITVVGVGLLAVGVVMLAAPGPGLIVIAIALFVLGLEYEWARRRYESVRRRADELAARAVARRSSLVGSGALATAVVVAGVVLMLVEEIPGSGLATGASVSAGGLVALATLVHAVLRVRPTASPRANARREGIGRTRR